MLGNSAKLFTDEVYVLMKLLSNGVYLLIRLLTNGVCPNEISY